MVISTGKEMATLTCKETETLQCKEIENSPMLTVLTMLKLSKLQTTSQHLMAKG